MARSLRHRSLAELRTLFEQAEGDRDLQRDVAEELGYRSTKAARTLKEQVDETLRRSTQKGRAATSVHDAQGNYGQNYRAASVTPAAKGAGPKEASSDAVGPECPKCGAVMYRRTARKGPRAGKDFWGCSRFRAGCKGIVNIDDGAPVPQAPGAASSGIVEAPEPRQSTVTPPAEAPDCPECGSPMVLRAVRRGARVGSSFWGCSTYPICKGSRNVDRDNDESDIGPASSAGAATSIPVLWTDFANRADWISEYLTVGALPGVLHADLDGNAPLMQAVGQCQLLARRGPPRTAADHQKLAAGLVLKVLQRGRAPLATLSVERAALAYRGLADAVDELDATEAEVGWQPKSGREFWVEAADVVAMRADREPFELDPSQRYRPREDAALLETPAENWFLEEWIPLTLGPKAGHWFTPQAPLDKILEGAGEESLGARRVDFLFSHPGGPPLVVEIDGPEHEDAQPVDAERDEALRKLGIDVVRVTHAEIDSGRGIALDRVREHCARALHSLQAPRPEREATAGLVHDCAEAARVQLAIARAVGYGWLPAGEDWEIVVDGLGPVAGAAVLDVLTLLAAIDELHADDSAPRACRVRADAKIVGAWVRGDSGDWVECPADTVTGPVTLAILVDSRSSPFHRTPAPEQYDFVVRPAHLPVEFSTELSFDLGRRPVAHAEFEHCEAALTVFLRQIFRKSNFRPLQGEAVFNTLRQNDCVVLLPTGAGKSIAYQLAGLLMPGLTLVVDPIISLIEDQVEGLRTYGIDRAAPIVGTLLSSGERRRLLRRVERGEYLFVLHSPERLQSPEFRSTLRALAQSSLINLAVIDEAHCVSEWGHDFRPAYLNLASNLRNFGADRDGDPPPLLALTGTASRAVLRDVLADLAIDRSRTDALLRPESFDRPELTFEIVRTSPLEGEQATLRGVLQALPAKFGLPKGEFYRPAGRATASGIIFVPTVNQKLFGVLGAGEAAQAATGAAVTYYSGRPPKGVDAKHWDREKRTNASEFKKNRVPTLVATKAFGMGIDKPNIRYTLHLGMPASLESFYQEAGRAGRDRAPARCLVIFSEYDAERTDTLLDPALGLEELREDYENAFSWNTQDDVMRALFFHLRSFTGADADIEEIDRVLDELGDFTRRQRLELPFWPGDSDNKSKERALYRLGRVGVVSDYEVEFGARRYIVDVEPLDFEDCKRRLADYMESAQPARAQRILRDLNTIRGDTPRELVLGLARVLIEFTYDVIERSRRLSIREAVLLARQARTDAEIRGRILDYLQEGLGAEHIETLLESTEVDLEAWWELVEKVQTPIDAGELRGLCIRSLESYPDHPGLVLARSLAEAMCSDRDAGVCVRGIDSAIRLAVDDYDVDRTELGKVLDAMFDLASSRAHQLAPLLLMALLDLGRADSGYAFTREVALARVREFDDDEVRAVVTVSKAQGAVDRLESAVGQMAERLDSPAVQAALTGA